MKEFRNPPDVHPPIGGYTHQIEIRGPERLLVISGQVGRSADGTVPEDPIAQLDLALENLTRNLAAAGMGVADIVKVNFYLVGAFDDDRRRATTAARLGAHRPCSTLVYVAALASPIYKIEVEAWASRPE